VYQVGNNKKVMTTYITV